MPSIRDLFTFYLKAEHLQGRTVTVYIESATVEPVFNPRSKRTEDLLIVRFANKRLALSCNKTQASAFEQVTGTDNYTQWTGHAVALSPGKTRTNQDTIVVSAPPLPKENQDDPHP